MINHKNCILFTNIDTNNTTPTIINNDNYIHYKEFKTLNDAFISYDEIVKKILYKNNNYLKELEDKNYIYLCDAYIDKYEVYFQIKKQLEKQDVISHIKKLLLLY